MPPKKGSKRKVEEAEEVEASTAAPKDSAVEKTASPKQSRDKKRAKPPQKDEDETFTTSTQRRSNRGKSQGRPSSTQLLNFLLSREAEDLCRPDDEKRNLAERGGSVTTYSSTDMTPFQELLCAVVLSRRISHTLGLRTIRTIFNDPYNFTNARAIQTAGLEKCREAMYDAHTQQSQKTAGELSHVAEVVLEKFCSNGGDDDDGEQLTRVREEAKRDGDAEHELLRSSIKGIGKTGLSIFFRRVQWSWDEVYPYVDARTEESLKKLGLPDDAEDLQNLIAKSWNQLEVKNIGGKDEEEKKRRAFVIVLERAIGGDLEHKTDELLDAAASS